MFSRGADEIVVPAPTAEIRESVEAVVQELPDERRKMIRLVDTRGSLFARIKDFVDPLVGYACKWPEDAFIAFSRTFLYHLALATQEKAAVAADSVEIVRGFVPIIDVRAFRGEGRYRLAELVSLIAAYDPIVAPLGSVTAPIVEQSTTNNIFEIIESAEFRRLTATSGVLGYLGAPALALRRIKRLFRDLLQHTGTRGALSIASVVGDVGAIGPIAKGVGKVAELTGATRQFAPPFLPLGSAEAGIYRVALAETFPGATPPPGTIMVLEHALGAISWRNEGEEQKLSPDVDEMLDRRRKRAAECRETQQRFFE